MEVNTASWHIRLACGKELHGSEIGSFVNVKHRSDIIDLWVETGAGKVHAPRRPGMKPTSFDFYIHVAVEDNGKTEKHWKLITGYVGHQLIKHIMPDGKHWTERVNGNEK